MNVDYTMIKNYFPNAEELFNNNFLILKLTKYPDAKFLYDKGINCFGESLYTYRIIYNIKSHIEYDSLFELYIVDGKRINIDYIDKKYIKRRNRDITTERQFKIALNKLYGE